MSPSNRRSRISTRSASSSTSTQQRSSDTHGALSSRPNMRSGIRNTCPAWSS
jgi:hypothetical protein